MKNSILWVFIAILLTACSSEKTDNTIVLTIDGGREVTINDKDVVRDIIVWASDTAESPITVILVSNAKTGEVVFSPSTLIIEKGETTSSAKISFTASKFPIGTAEKKITVTASTDATHAKFKTNTTDFYVKGYQGEDLKPNLTISAKNSNINTTDIDGVAEVSFTLDRMPDKDLPVIWSYDTGLTIDKDNITWSPEKIIIAKDNISTTALIKVKQGVKGTIPLKFSTTSPDVILNTKNLNLTFMIDPFPDTPIPLCYMTASSGSYAFTKTFTVGEHTLTPEHNLDGNYGYEDKTKTVTAEVTNGSLISIQMQNARSTPFDLYNLVAWIDWNRNGKLSDNERVLYKTIEAPVKGEEASPYSTELKIPVETIDGKYLMRLGVYYDDNSKLKNGCGMIDNGDMMDITIDYSAARTPEASVYAIGDTKIYVDDTDIVKTFVVARNVTTNHPVTIDLAVLSTGSDMPILSSSSITIPAGRATAEASITFKAADLTTSEQYSKVAVKITAATGIGINQDACTLLYDVTYSSQAEIPTVKLCPFSATYKNSIFTESFTVGDYTLTPKHTTTNKNYGYADMTGGQIIPDTKEGSRISITYGNQDSETASYVSAAWVDWNRDGNVDNSELVLFKEWSATTGVTGQVLGTIEGLFKAPVKTKPGAYIMRIGSSSKRNLKGGCGVVDNADMFDIKINYSK